MTWSEFTAEVQTFLHSYSRMVGTQNLIAATTKAGVRDLLSNLPSLRRITVRAIPNNAFLTDGYAARARVPVGAMLTQVFVRKTDDHSQIANYAMLGRNNLDLMKQGLLRAGDRYACYLSSSGELWVSPVPSSEDSEVVVRYETNDLDYDDTDEVPFDSEVAEAVSEYVLAQLALKVDRDAQLSALHQKNFTAKKRQLLSDAMEATRVPNRQE